MTRGKLIRTAIALLCLGSLVGPLSALAQEPGEPELRWRAATEVEKKAATAAIEGQLKAFKADDFVTAEKFQHSALREGLRTPDFRRMMKSSYPQVVNYKKVIYGPIRASMAAGAAADGEMVEVPTTLVGEDNITVKMIYTLAKEGGQYRVAGVQGGMPTRVPIREVV